MASVFWGAHGLIFIDYLEKGKTINSDYCTALLDRLKAEIVKKTTAYGEEKNFVSPRQCTMSQVNKNNKLHELHFELLPHPPYSPDLAPSDYWLFADLKTKCSPERNSSEMKKQLQKLKPILTKPSTITASRS